MKRVFTRKFQATGHTSVLRVTCEIDQDFAAKCNQMPSFSMCGEEFSRQARRGETRIKVDGTSYWTRSFGQLHDQIAEVFPELAKFSRYHLWDARGPMHYVANAIYWFQIATGVIDAPSYYPKRGTIEASNAASYFLKHVGFDSKLDKVPAFEPTMAGCVRVITPWCEARLPRILDEYRAAMSELESLQLPGCV